MTDKTKPEAMTAERVGQVRARAALLWSRTLAELPGVLREVRELAGEDVPALLSALEEARLRVDRAHDCGQKDVCATPPGCGRHWAQRNRKLVTERDEAIAASAEAARKYAEAAVRVAELEGALATARERASAGSPGAIKAIADRVLGDAYAPLPSTRPPRPGRTTRPTRTGCCRNWRPRRPKTRCPKLKPAASIVRRARRTTESVGRCGPT